MPKLRQWKSGDRRGSRAIHNKHGGFPVVAERLGLKLAYCKKTLGYWNDFCNIEREILTFIEAHGTPAVMPTNEELKKLGQTSLAAAIQKHGGFPSVANQLGLKLPYTAKPSGYWNDFSNLKNEILAFIEDQGNLGVMPTMNELNKVRRSDLARATQKHGGYPAVAEQLGLTYTRKRPDYWNNFANVERELPDFIEEYGTPGVMPTQEEFKKAGQSSLTAAICKHGGYQSVAERLGLELAYTAKPPGYWEKFDNFERELLAFIKEHV